MEERAASQLICCRLAEPSPEGGTEGRHLTSRVRCGHARCRTSTPWLYERQNPSRGRTCGPCCLNTQLAIVSVVGAREGSLKKVPAPPSFFSPRLASLWPRSGFKCRLSLPLSHHPVLCAPIQQHKPRGQHGQGRSVSREGKRAPSLSFITQVSTRPTIFF